jgi:hypothetical protein
MRDQTRERASNWSLFSFANSNQLEEHLSLSEYGLKKNELFEVRILLNVFLFKPSLNLSIIIQLHRMGRFVPLDRTRYVEPHFDSISYHGKIKHRHRMRGDRRSTDSRSLKVRSSSSSINIMAQMQSVSSSSMARRGSIVGISVSEGVDEEIDKESEIALTVEPSPPLVRINIARHMQPISSWICTAHSVHEDPIDWWAIAATLAEYAFIHVCEAS